MSFKLQDRIQGVKGLPGKYKRLLLAMAKHARNDGTNIYTSKQTLADEMGVDRKTVYRNMEVVLVTGLVIEAASHVCRNEFCPKADRHYTEHGNHWTQAYNIDLVALQNVMPLLKKSRPKVSQRSRDILSKSRVPKCHANLGIENPAPLGANLESSVLTDGESKERKEPLLASLVAEGSRQIENQNLLTDQAEEPKATPPPEVPWQVVGLLPSVDSLQAIWRRRTGRVFGEEELVAANTLILAHRFRVVEAVLHNCLWQRPNSAKLRWNDFTIFARNWERNHEEYLAWCAMQRFDKHPGSDHCAVTPKTKFDRVPEMDEFAKDQQMQQHWKELKKWLKEQGKVGEWELVAAEWEALGLHYGHVYVTLKYIGEEGYAVTKDTFMALLMEAAGLQAKAAAAGFDPQEA